MHEISKNGGNMCVRACLCARVRVCMSERVYASVRICVHMYV